MKPETQNHTIYLCFLLLFFSIIPIHLWPQFCSCLSSAPALCVLLAGVHHAQAGNTSRLCTSKIPQVSSCSCSFYLFHSLSSVLILAVSQGQRLSTLESAELEMWGVWEWGRLGKATRVYLQALVTLIRSTQLLNLFYLLKSPCKTSFKQRAPDMKESLKISSLRKTITLLPQMQLIEYRA